MPTGNVGIRKQGQILKELIHMRFTNAEIASLKFTALTRPELAVLKSFE